MFLCYSYSHNICKFIKSITEGKGAKGTGEPYTAYNLIKLIAVVRKTHKEKWAVYGMAITKEITFSPKGRAQLAFSWMFYLIKTIDVMKFPVLPVAMMNGVLRHGLLLPSKDRGLIHVIPYVEDVSRSLGSKSWSGQYFYSDDANMIASPNPLSYST